MTLFLSYKTLTGPDHFPIVDTHTGSRRYWTFNQNYQKALNSLFGKGGLRGDFLGHEVGHFSIFRRFGHVSFRYEDHVGGAPESRRKEDAPDSGHGIQ